MGLSTTTLVAGDDDDDDSYSDEDSSSETDHDTDAESIDSDRVTDAMNSNKSSLAEIDSEDDSDSDYTENSDESVKIIKKRKYIKSDQDDDSLSNECSLAEIENEDDKSNEENDSEDDTDSDICSIAISTDEITYESDLIPDDIGLISIDYAKSNRTECEKCKRKIYKVFNLTYIVFKINCLIFRYLKNEIRLAEKLSGSAKSWYHLDCFIEKTNDLEFEAKEYVCQFYAYSSYFNHIVFKIIIIQVFVDSMI